MDKVAFFFWAGKHNYKNGYNFARVHPMPQQLVKNVEFRNSKPNQIKILPELYLQVSVKYIVLALVLIFFFFHFFTFYRY